MERWGEWVFSHGPPGPGTGWWQFAYLIPLAMVAVGLWEGLTGGVQLIPVDAPALALGMAWGFPLFFGGWSLGLAARTRGIPLRYLGAIALLAFAQLPFLAVLFMFDVSPGWTTIGFLVGITLASLFTAHLLRKALRKTAPG